MVRSLAAQYPGRVTYLPVASSLDLDGHYSAWLPTVSGGWIRARKTDNTHLCPAGAAVLGAAITQELPPDVRSGPRHRDGSTSSWTSDGLPLRRPRLGPARTTSPPRDHTRVQASVDATLSSLSRHGVGLQQPIERRLWPWLTVWTVVGLGIRFASVYGRPHRAGRRPRVMPGGWRTCWWRSRRPAGLHEFHNQHVVFRTAGWPRPLWTFFLTVPPFFGFHSFFAARFWSCLIGALAIVVCGLAGREIGSSRVGLIAALLIAVYPNIWMNNELASSETLSPLVVALILWTAYRFWKRPTGWNVAALGASVGLATLCRDELALLAILIVVPLVLLVRSAQWHRARGAVGHRRGQRLGPGVPLGRLQHEPLREAHFHQRRARHHPGVGKLRGHLVGTRSRATGHSPAGDLRGHVDTHSRPSRCRLRPGPGLVPSARSTSTPTRAELSQVEPGPARPGFGPSIRVQQVEFDASVETRPYHWALVGLGMYYALSLSLSEAPSSCAVGAYRSFPCGPWGSTSCPSPAHQLRQTRYRVTFEVSLVLLAAVQLEWFWSGCSRPAGTRGSPALRTRSNRPNRRAPYPWGPSRWAGGRRREPGSSWCCRPGTRRNRWAWS